MVGASRSSLLPPSEPLLGSGLGLRISLTASPLPCTAGELGLWGLLGPVTLESDGQGDARRLVALRRGVGSPRGREMGPQPGRRGSSWHGSKLKMHSHCLCSSPARPPPPPSSSLLPSSPHLLPAPPKGLHQDCPTVLFSQEDSVGCLQAGGGALF